MDISTFPHLGQEGGATHSEAPSEFGDFMASLGQDRKFPPKVNGDFSCRTLACSDSVAGKMVEFQLGCPPPPP